MLRFSPAHLDRPGNWTGSQTGSIKTVRSVQPRRTVDSSVRRGCGAPRCQAPIDVPFFSPEPGSQLRRSVTSLLTQSPNLGPRCAVVLGTGSAQLSIEFLFRSSQTGLSRSACRKSLGGRQPTRAVPTDRREGVESSRLPGRLFGAVQSTSRHSIVHVICFTSDPLQPCLFRGDKKRARSGKRITNHPAFWYQSHDLPR